MCWADSVNIDLFVYVFIYSLLKLFNTYNSNQSDGDVASISAIVVYDTRRVDEEEC